MRLDSVSQHGMEKGKKGEGNFPAALRGGRVKITENGNDAPLSNSLPSRGRED